jgi:hypothetical protein
MATLETVLRVFVASPSDVADARKRLERIVDELNYTWSREIRLRLELLRWETHAYPGIGDDAQDVINRQLDEFDIFLGIMWKRFGQPTGRAGSGTEEEYDRARQRFDANPNALRMMFYFKDAPPPSLSDVDPVQIEAVRRFREKIERSGMLHWTYRGLQDFERLVRRHLGRQIQEWGKTWGSGIRELPRTAATSAEKQDAHDDLSAPTEENAARSITAIVFDEMAVRHGLVQRRDHDPEVIHRSFLEAQLLLDHSPAEDAWGLLAAQQATALVAIALAGRLAPNEDAREYVAQVCERIIGLRGLRIEWGVRGRQILYDLLTKASGRQDDAVLLWIKRHAKKRK